MRPASRNGHAWWAVSSSTSGQSNHNPTRGSANSVEQRHPRGEPDFIAILKNPDNVIHGFIAINIPPIHNAALHSYTSENAEEFFTVGNTDGRDSLGEGSDACMHS